MAQACQPFVSLSSLEIWRPFTAPLLKGMAILEPRSSESRALVIVVDGRPTAPGGEAPRIVLVVLCRQECTRCCVWLRLNEGHPGGDKTSGARCVSWRLLDS